MGPQRGQSKIRIVNTLTMLKHDDLWGLRAWGIRGQGAKKPTTKRGQIDEIVKETTEARIAWQESKNSDRRICRVARVERCVIIISCVLNEARECF